MSPTNVDGKALRPIGAIGHPLWVLALLVLVFNDHFLKRAGILPGEITGKLSDFAGLFVAAPLFAVLVRARTARAVLAAHVAVGLGFGLLELSPAANGALRSLYQAAGVGFHSTLDLTDLAALLVLPLTYRFTLMQAARADVAERTLRQARPIGALVATVACAASTADPFLVEPCGRQCEPWQGPGEEAELFCDDGFDDDGDGLVDCDDEDCAAACEGLNALCAGAPSFTLGSGERFSVAMSTLGLGSVTESSCAGADAPDVVLGLEVARPGRLFVTPPENHNLSLRRDCNAWHTEIGCTSPAPEPQPSAAFELPQPGYYFLVLHANDGLVAGSFQLELAYVDDGCGDGMRDEGEFCDDGNTQPGDGCDELCRPEYALLCAVAETIATGDTQATLAGGTIAFTTCGEGSGLDQPERLFRYVSDFDGALEIALSGVPLLGLQARDDCTTPLANTPCAAMTTPGETATLVVPVTVGSETAIVVEAIEPLAEGADTSFTLTLTAQPGM